MLKDKNLGSKTVITFGLKLASVSLNFAIGVLVAQILGVNGFGAYSFIIAWVNILATIFVFGLDQVLMRELAANISLGKWDLAKGLLLFVHIIVAIGALIGAAIFYAYLVGIQPLDSFEVGIYLGLTSAIALYFRAQMYVQQREMRGIGLVLMGQLPELFYRPILFSIPLAVLYFYYETNNLTIILALFAASFGIAYFIGLVQCRRAYPSELKTKTPEFHFQQWTNSGKSFWGINVLSVVVRELDVILLGFLSSLSDAAIYAVIKRSIMFFAFGSTSVNMVFAPSLASAHSSQKTDRLANLYGLATGWGFLLSLPILLGLVALGDYLLGFFGEEMKIGYQALLLVGLGELVQLILGPAMLALNMTGKEKVSIRILAFSAFIKVILSIYLIPEHGFMGAAIASVITLAIQYLLASIYLYKHIGLSPVVLKRVLPHRL